MLKLILCGSFIEGYGVALAKVAASQELPFGLRQISLMLQYVSDGSSLFLVS